MLCKNPFTKGLVAFGCGQCLPCRINKSRLWTHRILLESMCHEKTMFLTLTYNDENLPTDGSLKPDDVKLFLKRLRKLVYPGKVRYFFVGEYGDLSQRPHYHAALFGLGVEDQVIIEKAWPFGFVYCGTLENDSARYISGYVVKRMTNPKDQKVKEFLNGRYPEFARMSLKPGIGALAVSTIATDLSTDGGAECIISHEDVPGELRHGKHKLPLGRYLKTQIRRACGFKEENAQEGWQKKQAQKMLKLYEKNGIEKKYRRFTDIKLLLEKENAQKIKNLEARHLIFNKKGNI